MASMNRNVRMMAIFLDLMHFCNLIYFMAVVILFYLKFRTRFQGKWFPPEIGVTDSTAKENIMTTMRQVHPYRKTFETDGNPGSPTQWCSGEAQYIKPTRVIDHWF